MATAGGEPGSRLSDRLLAAPEAFEVFAAVRLLEDERARAALGAAAEPPPEVGSQDAGAGVGDPVRFRAAATLGFPGGAIVGARRADPGTAATEEAGAGPVELEVASFGLVGPAGVLPRHYTVLVLERLRRFRDRAMRDFLDLFTHRALSLLVRAFGKYRVALQRGLLTGRRKGVPWDDAASPRDATTAVLACLVGLGGRTLPGRMRIEDSLLLYYSGHLSRQPASALPLEQLVADAWQVPARVEQFVGRWIDLEPEDQTQLGGGHAVLGADALAGRRVWSVEAAYCVRLGPLSLPEFLGWLPGGQRLESLSDLLTFHVGPVLEATVRPVLRAAEVPQTWLGGAAGSRLGWTSWLTSRPPDHDVDDASFSVAPWDA